MIFDWNEQKNQLLKQERNICFEQVVIAIDEGTILDVLEHPDQEKYKNQYLIIVEIDSYAYVVPSVIEDDYWFLKTIFPSRKYTKIYLNNTKEDNNGK